MRPTIIWTGPGVYLPIVHADGSVRWIYDYSPDTWVGVYVPNVANAQTFADLYDVMSDTESAPVVAQMEAA